MPPRLPLISILSTYKFSFHNHCIFHIYLSKMGRNVVASSKDYYQSQLLLQCKALVSRYRAKRSPELSLCCLGVVKIRNRYSPQCRLLRPPLHEPSLPSPMCQRCRCCHQVGAGDPAACQWGRSFAGPTILGKMISVDPWFCLVFTLLLFSLSISQSPKMFEISNKISSK